MDRALQLRLRLGEQFAHLLDPRAEFDDALVGELRRGDLLGRELRGGGIGGRRPRPPDEDGEAGNGEADDQAESDEEGGFHEACLTRFALGRSEPRRPEDSRQEQIENTLTAAKSSP